MRGRKVFKELIERERLGTQLRKGRNNHLNESRNKCLLDRYFYYGFVKNLTYEETIKRLSVEFFISPTTIGNIIQDNVDNLKAIRKSGFLLFSFRLRWPHLKW